MERLAVPNMSRRDYKESKAILAEHDQISDIISPVQWDDLN